MTDFISTSTLTMRSRVIYDDDKVAKTAPEER